MVANKLYSAMPVRLYTRLDKGEPNDVEIESRQLFILLQIWAVLLNKIFN